MIRAYTADDLDDALDAWYEASIIAHSFLPDEFFVAERVELAERLLPAAETYVFEVDGRLVGFVSLAPGHVDRDVDHDVDRDVDRDVDHDVGRDGGGEVGGLFVHPDHQGQGVGRALMDHARSLRSGLELDVFEENARARRFYGAYGFELVSAFVDPHTGHRQHRLRLD